MIFLERSPSSVPNFLALDLTIYAFPRGVPPPPPTAFYYDGRIVIRSLLEWTEPLALHICCLSPFVGE